MARDPKLSREEASEWLIRQEMDGLMFALTLAVGVGIAGAVIAGRAGGWWLLAIPLCVGLAILSVSQMIRRDRRVKDEIRSRRHG